MRPGDKSIDTETISRHGGISERFATVSEIEHLCERSVVPTPPQLGLADVSPIAG